MIELLKWIGSEYGIVAVFALLLFWQNREQRKEDAKRQEANNERSGRFLETILSLATEIRVLTEEMKDVKVEVEQLTNFVIESDTQKHAYKP